VGQSLAERGPLVTVGGPTRQKCRKFLRNDSESLDVVDVYTRLKNTPKNAKKQQIKEY